MVFIASSESGGLTRNLTRLVVIGGKLIVVTGLESSRTPSAIKLFCPS